MSTPTPTQALMDECHRQAENCSFTAISFTIWLRFLRMMRTLCAVAPVVFGVMATGKIITQSSPLWAAVFTMLATLIPPAYRASKTDTEIEEYTTLTGEFTNLRDRFRQAALISSQKPLAEFEVEFKSLVTRLEKARSRALTPPEWCFFFARRKEKAGHYHHDYDEKKNK